MHNSRPASLYNLAVQASEPYSSSAQADADTMSNICSRIGQNISIYVRMLHKSQLRACAYYSLGCSAGSRIYYGSVAFVPVVLA